MPAKPKREPRTRAPYGSHGLYRIETIASITCVLCHAEASIKNPKGPNGCRHAFKALGWRLSLATEFTKQAYQCPECALKTQWCPRHKAYLPKKQFYPSVDRGYCIACMNAVYHEKKKKKSIERFNRSIAGIKH